MVVFAGRGGRGGGDHGGVEMRVVAVIIICQRCAALRDWRSERPPEMPPLLASVTRGLLVFLLIFLLALIRLLLQRGIRSLSGVTRTRCCWSVRRRGCYFGAERREQELEGKNLQRIDMGKSLRDVYVKLDASQSRVQ